MGIGMGMWAWLGMGIAVVVQTAVSFLMPSSLMLSPLMKSCSVSLLILWPMHQPLTLLSFTVN